MFVPPDSRAANSPEFRLVRAALLLFFKDADDYLKETPSTLAEVKRARQQAFNDLIRCGKMTRRLAQLNDLDAQALTEGFRGYVRRYYSEVQPETDVTHTDEPVSAR